MTTRYTYVQHDDNLVEIIETGGLFFGYTLDQVRDAAEKTYPNYQHGNLSYTFSDQFFNFSVRKALLCSMFPPITNTHPTELDSLTTEDGSGRNKPSIDTDSLSD
jgi:hypothetical protein